MSEPEAELQATANLSPVSPSPVHSAASQVVPALQDTVDNLDAMVAAAAAAAASSGVDDSTRPVDPVVGPDDNDDIVDDDSFNDAYGEDTSEPAPQPQLHQQEQVDDNDDYAKTFDSPIGPEEGEEEEFQPEDVSMPRESNDITHITDHLTSRLSEASRVPEPSSSSTAQPQGASASPITTSKPNPDGVVQMVQATQPSIPGQAGLHPTPSALSINAGSNDYSDSPNPSTDIQRLVADFTTQSAEPSSNLDASASFAGAEQPAGSSTLPSALPSASLPPRPPLPHSASQSYAAQHHPSGPNTSIPVSVVAPATPGQPSNFVVAGAPGTSTDTLSSLPPPPLAGLNAPVTIASLNPPSYPSHPPAYATDRSQETEYQRQWDQFMADERQYMSEAKWDRFPEGSRIFIGTRSTSGASKNGAHIFCTGNLSSDKVSKRDVFDLFHRFGRLAQISLKSAYGFVQYHTIEEGRRAMEHLQGIEIKGRRIHLEVSRVQDKAKKERARSPDRGDRGRARDAPRRNDRYGQQGRDDYRTGRNSSPRRSDYGRDDGYGRDRGSRDGGRGRGRSRSPAYGRNEKDSYRRRSPSPFARPRHDSSSLDIPRRFGPDVPDVQIIMAPDVSRDFANWVEGAFKVKGLKSEVMYLHPRLPKGDIVRQQAAEGVHAVVDLDLQAQNIGRIPVQAFDRSGGLSNIRFDQYVDLDPSTAAEVISRAKASGAAHYTQHYGNGNGYSNPYNGLPQQPPQAPHYGGVGAGQYPAQKPQVHPTDITRLIGQVDNATLQSLLASFQAAPQNGLHGAASGGPQAFNAAPAAPGPQVDVQAILGSLSGSIPGQQPLPPAQGTYGAFSGQPGPGHDQPPTGANGDAAAQVQNIMAQLARYR